MVYTKTVWVASTAPGISAANLNNLETQYDNSVVIGEIKLYSGTTAPTNFFLCNGTSKASATYASLFAVTSHYFGGTSDWFHLPNLQGHFPVGYSGAGDYTIGSTGGSSEVTIATSQMPAHVHTIDRLAAPVAAANGLSYVTNLTVTGTVNSNSAGGGEAHENRPPYVVLNYIIRYQ